MRKSECERCGPRRSSAIDPPNSEPRSVYHDAWLPNMPRHEAYHPADTREVFVTARFSLGAPEGPTRQDRTERRMPSG
ncbi:MAG: hypothetical protein LAO51_11555 [Acidobacteriia bacterium]|nr:hypothetical protein [Terriglobia bacterium]